MTTEDPQDDLSRALLLERFGPLPTLAKERAVDGYADQRRRRRVLLGEKEVTGFPQAVDL